MQAEVQRRLLNHTVGQVGPKGRDDVAGEVDEVGIGPDLGEIGCHPIGRVLPVALTGGESR